MDGIKEYFVGLDIGTSSVGWAVTDVHYNLLRKKVIVCWEVVCLMRLKLHKSLGKEGGLKEG